MISPDRTELQDLVRQWHQQALPWTPAGTGTRLHWGAPLEQPQLLRTAKLNRLLHHSSGDFTVTVEAGLPLIELQVALAESKQWLAVDWPWGSEVNGDQSGTIGGLIARGMAGGFHQRYMGIRDQVIGLEVMRADGTVAKAGGQVVKNVAGYDLMRLFCGSWGSLGLITKVTLRTFPIQPYSAGLLFKGKSEDLEAMRKACLINPFMTKRLDWLRLEEQMCLMLAMESISLNAIHAQTQDLLSISKDLKIQGIVLDNDGILDLESRGRAAGQDLKKERWLIQIEVPPAAAHQLLSKFQIEGDGFSLGAGSGQGLLWGGSDKIPAHKAKRLQDECGRLGGKVFFLQRQADLPSAREFIVSRNQDLCCALKREFDPLQQLKRPRASTQYRSSLQPSFTQSTDRHCWH